MSPVRVLSFSAGSAGRFGGGALLLGGALVMLAPACSSDDSTPSDGGSEGGVCPPGGGAVASEAGPDDHCSGDGGPIKQPATTCPTTPGDAAETDAAAETYPEAHPGTEADDDDCKYHVSFTVTCVQRGEDATFTITVTQRTDGSALTGADPQIEATLGDTHPLPNTPAPVTTEVGGGKYTISHVRFDASGVWTVRFHFFEMCLDTEETSKHAHVAFLINVP